MKSSENKETYIKDAKSEHWKICTYGLGYLGRRLYNEIPSILGLKADYYSDGNDEKVDAINLPGIERIYKSDLLKLESPTLVFILVDDPYDIEIQEMLSFNHNLYTLTLRELAQMEIVLEFFYGQKLYKEYITLADYSNKS